MDEKIKFSEAYSQNRVVLADVLPLEVPLCISIEPTNICNFKCKMCGQNSTEYKEHGGPFSLMEIDLFDKVIDQIVDWCGNNKKVKLMKLYSLGEPLLHPQIGYMLKKIKEAGIANQVEITSNASLLTEKIARELVDNGLDYFRASIYSIYNDKLSEVTQQKKYSADTVKANLGYMKQYRDEKGLTKPFICSKMFQDDSTDENAVFQMEYKAVSDEQFIDVAFEVPGLENSSLDNLFGEENGAHADAIYHERALYKERKACRYPFTHLTIKHNGDVVICCTDWLRDTKLGNVNDTTLEAIWNSKNLYDFRSMMLKTKGINHHLCATCEIPYKDCKEDNIDSVSIDRFSWR